MDAKAARLMALFVVLPTAALVPAACIGPEPQAGPGVGGVGGAGGITPIGGAGMGGTNQGGGGSSPASSTGASTSMGGMGGMGGAGPLPGQLGYPCTLATQCNSFFCEDGVCCDEFCTEDCKSCLAANTNGVDGTCSPFPAYADPNGACPLAAEACDGVDGCKLILGEPCNGGLDCISGNCANLFCAPP